MGKQDEESGNKSLKNKRVMQIKKLVRQGQLTSNGSLDIISQGSEACSVKTLYEVN